jgi:hypothetical protein
MTPVRSVGRHGYNIRLERLLRGGAAALLIAVGFSADDCAMLVRDAAAQAVTIAEVVPPQVRPNNRFGTRTFLRNSGNTLFVAAPGDPLNPQTGEVHIRPWVGWGSVHVFARSSAGAWQQTALLRPLAGDRAEWGLELAVSGDGNTVAVGAPEDRGRGSGIGSDPFDQVPFPSSGVVEGITGAVWVFAKRGAAWELQAYVKAAHPDQGDLFGFAIALSHDGNWMAVGAPNEGSRSPSNDRGDRIHGAGAVYLFRRDAAGQWAQVDFIKALHPDAGDGFGGTLAMSDDGSVLAVGAPGESSFDCRIDGNQADNSQPGAGAVYVFERTRQNRMRQRTYVKACDTPGENRFGLALALNPAGNLLVVGAPFEDGPVRSTSVHDLPPPDRPWVGRAYVFTRSGDTWVRSAALGASNAGRGDRFGNDVKLSHDGSTLAIGAPGEDSGLTGVDPAQGNDSLPDTGAIYVFRRNGGGAIAQAHYLKPARLEQVNKIVGEHQFNGLDLSEDGSVLAMGVFSGGPLSPLAPDQGPTGTVFVYRGL